MNPVTSLIQYNGFAYLHKISLTTQELSELEEYLCSIFEHKIHF